MIKQIPGAPLIGALLFSAALILASWAAGARVAAAGAACPASRYHDRGTVRQVYDGDTVELVGGDKVRLLGINTPELGHDDRLPEPFAEPARTFLESLAPPGARVKLRFDVERADRYGRLLAHVFLDNGANVQAELLEAGLATTLVVPPNEWNHLCYDRLERAARDDRRGIWRLERYRPIAANGLKPDTRGFRIITGQVIRIGESRGNLWLNLAPGVALRIPRDDLIYFRAVPPRSLLFRRVEARGFVHRRKGELRMTVRHPAALRPLD